MSQLTVGQLIEALEQLPADTPVRRAETYRAWPLPDMEKLRFVVWPQTSGPCLLVGHTSYMEEGLLASGIEAKRLTLDMEQPCAPKSSKYIWALEQSGWPWAAAVLTGVHEVGERATAEFIEDWEQLFGPLPEWADIKEEDHSDG